MKNEKVYIEKLILDDVYADEIALDKSKKITKFKKNNPKKPKSKHNVSGVWSDDLD